ncbi:MAG: four helix bundle protein [bacterium]|nr:four helix bundle protein [bacterium]
MIKPSRNPYGYRNLLVYNRADELQSLCSRLTSHFSHSKTLIALADQMNRSARSTKQNITEGWKRNSTKEYYEFLGYAVASNAELEEDFTDIWKGHYPELMGIKGVMGERRVMGERGTGEKGEKFPPLESIPFYPLDPLLPPVVQLKLRAKELNFLIEKLQKSLVEKMSTENTLPTSERIRLSEQREKDFDHWLEEQKRKGSNGSNG